MSGSQAEDREPAPSDSGQPSGHSSRTIKLDSNEFKIDPKNSAGNALLKNQTTVVFSLVDTDVLLPIHVADRIVIGRLDFDSIEKIDIDLMPYGARERGVSRQHAALYRTRHTVSLVDLKSSNGTYLNGLKLVPLQPRLLREDDEVRLGSMRFRINFDR